MHMCMLQVDPSGSYFAWRASALGSNYINAAAFLERRYAEDMELEDAIHTALLTLREGFEVSVCLCCLCFVCARACVLLQALSSKVGWVGSFCLRFAYAARQALAALVAGHKVTICYIVVESWSIACFTRYVHGRLLALNSVVPAG